MRNSTPCWLIVIFTSFCWVGHSQSFKTLNADFPLPVTRSILQDSFGFLWIGTNDGLFKYNGYGVEQPVRDSLTSQTVRALAEDNQRRLWIGKTNTGIQVYDRRSMSVHSVILAKGDTIGLNNVSVYELTASDTSMWAGTSSGLFEISLHDLSVIRHLDSQGPDSISLTASLVSSLCLDKNGMLWIGCVNGLNCLDTRTGKVVSYRTRPSYPSRQIPQIKEGPDGTVWVSARFEPFHFYKLPPGADTFQVDSVFSAGLQLGSFRFDISKEGILYISSRGNSAIIYDPVSGEYEMFRASEGARHGMRGYYNYPTLYDKYGNFWTGGGLLYFRPGSNKDFRSLYTEGYSVISVFADDERIWYGSRLPFRIGHREQTPETFLYRKQPDLRGSNSPLRLYMTKRLDERRLVMTSTRNVNIWDTRTDEFIEYQVDRGGPFRDFDFGDKNDIWIAGNQGVVHHLDLNTGAALPLPDETRVIQNPITVCRAPNGSLWWGTSNVGIYEMSTAGKILRHIAVNESRIDTTVLGFRVIDIQFISDELMCVGTDKGLTVYNVITGYSKFYTTDNGMPSNVVSSIVQDGVGRLWLGTQQGLVRLDLTNDSIDIYTRQNGLMNSAYTARAVSEGPDGVLYFGGAQGIDYFDPLKVEVNTVPPDVLLDEIKVNNREYVSSGANEVVSELKLDHDENFIELTLVGVHLTAPNTTHYEYRINNSEWVSTGTVRVISLANTAPGEYTVEARAANADGVWSEPREIIQLTISPPWWKTGWFYSLLALTIALVIYAIYKRRVRAIEQEQKRQTEIDKLIAEVEMKALRAQMNPHFIFNSLNSVQSLIVKGQTDEAIEYLTSFAKLIRVVLNNSRSKWVKLADDLQAVKLYLKLEKLRFKNFNFNISVGDSIDPHFTEVPPMLIQPFVENSIWHGISHNEGVTGQIDIRIVRNGDLLEFHIIDNGIGRKKAGELQTRSRSKQESLGTTITEDRLSILSGIYGDQASVEVIDLDNPTGTHVIVRLPIPE